MYIWVDVNSHHSHCETVRSDSMLLRLGRDLNFKAAACTRRLILSPEVVWPQLYLSNPNLTGEVYESNANIV